VVADPARRPRADLGFPKVTRPVAMLSLDNTYNEDELRAFYDRVVKGLDGDVPAFSSSRRSTASGSS